MGISMLPSPGYKVTGVNSSMEALDLFRAEPECFDLVITDMTLPKMTGIELSRAILQISPDIPTSFAPESANPLQKSRPNLCLTT